jgi:hypothetical protein
MTRDQRHMLERTLAGGRRAGPQWRWCACGGGGVAGAVVWLPAREVANRAAAGGWWRGCSGRDVTDGPGQRSIPAMGVALSGSG